MENLLIKDQKGKTIPLNVHQEDDSFILCKKNYNKLPNDQKRTVKVFVMDKVKLDEFRKAQVKAEDEKSILGKFLYDLIESIRNLNPIC